MTNQQTQHISTAIENTAELVELYRGHAEALRAVRDEQRALRDDRPDMKRQLDDVEAEITYLRLRDRRPDTVVEIGCLHGWSTSWILRALRDNGSGTLHSYDLRPDAVDRVPAELADARWRFTAGDVRHALAQRPDEIDYLFVDAAHTAPFARWYLRRLVERLPGGTPVSVHDVHHHRRQWPVSEPRTVLKWLRRNGISHITAARAARDSLARQLAPVRAELGLAEPIHTGDHNPMIFFTTPPWSDRPTG